jgi:hypothetical protein
MTAMHEAGVEPGEMAANATHILWILTDLAKVAKSSEVVAAGVKPVSAN